MPTREELADLIRDIYNHSDIQYEFPADDAADAILARWRLVPVGTAGDDAGMLIHAMVDQAGGKVTIPMSWFVLAEGALTIVRNAADDSVTLYTEPAQHRAADELTTTTNSRTLRGLT